MSAPEPDLEMLQYASLVEGDADMIAAAISVQKRGKELQAAVESFVALSEGRLTIALEQRVKGRAEHVSYFVGQLHLACLDIFGRKRR